MTDAPTVLVVGDAGDGGTLAGTFDSFATVRFASTTDETREFLTETTADCVVAIHDPPATHVRPLLGRVAGAPVIVVTVDEGADVYELLEAGATDCLPVPSSETARQLLADRVEAALADRVETALADRVDAALADRRVPADQRVDYQVVVEEAQDGLYAMDEEGRYLMVNRSMVDLSGYDRDQLLGMNASELLTPESATEGRRRIRALLRSDSRRSDTWEMELVTADGDHVPCEIHYALLPADADDYRGIVGVIRDVTERKRREEELRQQRERFEEFASVVSHDLRNPLTVAAGRTDHVRSRLENAADPDGAASDADADTDPDVDALVSHLETACAAHDRMTEIIDDLLTLARRGEVIGETERTTLAAVTQRAWQSVRAESGTLEISADRPLEADTERLRQLLENLLANAVEHGGTDVSVRVGATEDGFFVADDGPGIPPEDHDRVFDHGYTTAIDGTGFGLSIVDRIATAHGWDVEVVDVEEGARFEVGGLDPLDSAHSS